MKKISERTFQTWKARFRREWNQPSRSDYYMMQVSADIHNLFKGGTQLEDRKIPWNFTITVDQSAQAKELSEEELNAEHEALWRGVEAVLKARYYDERSSGNS